MKKIFFLFAIVLLYDCDKWDNCVGMVNGKSETFLVSKEEAATIKTLFESNNLKFDNLQYYRLNVWDNIGYSVKCYQYVNNLKILNAHLSFHFDEQGRLGNISGDTISQISVDPNPSMSISELKRIYFGYTLNDTVSYLSRARFKCLTCELGYYKLIKGNGSSYETEYVLAWIVKPDGIDYPRAIINDSEKSLISYFNGIMHN